MKAKAEYQAEIAEMLALGIPKTRIAKRLGISIRTLYRHLSESQKTEEISISSFHKENEENQEIAKSTDEAIKQSIREASERMIESLQSDDD